jgi:ribosomal protein S21
MRNDKYAVKIFYTKDRTDEEKTERFDRALKKFNRKIMKNETLDLAIEKMRFEKPSEKKRRLKARDTFRKKFDIEE